MQLFETILHWNRFENHVGNIVFQEGNHVKKKATRPFEIILHWNGHVQR